MSYEIEIEELPGLQNYEAEIEYYNYLNEDEYDEQFLEQYIEQYNKFEQEYVERLSYVYMSEMQYWEEYDHLKCLPF